MIFSSFFGSISSVIGAGGGPIRGKGSRGGWRSNVFYGEGGTDGWIEVTGKGGRGGWTGIWDRR